MHTVVRIIRVGCVLGALTLRILVQYPRGPRDLERLGERLAACAERLGGAFLKAAQIFAARSDLLPCQVRRPLARLQERVRASIEPHPQIERILAKPTQAIFSAIDPQPVGSASIAEVFRATSHGRPVAIKLRRPHTNRLFEVDFRIARSVLSAARRWSVLRDLPLLPCFDRVARCVIEQTDLRKEAAFHRQFWRLFQRNEAILVPRIHEELVHEEMLVTEYIHGLRPVNDPTLNSELRQQAIVVGLQALYTMIFRAGLVHCDLHAGNVQIAPDGRLVLLDFGAATVLAPRERVAFARFFISIACNDAASAAEVILEVAEHVPENLDRRELEQQLGALLLGANSVTAGEFSVASFVASLFQVQRNLHIHGSDSFATAIMALAVYEGLIKEYCPQLDFQGEAVPFAMAALAEHDRAREAAC